MYSDILNKTLLPCTTEQETVIDLFSGCGGLSLGFEAAGYRTIGYECLASASNTYNKNLKGICHTTMLTIGYDYPKADIVIGGPPCQPFSVRGKQKGIQDARDGFPIFIDAIARIKPRLFLFENVRNLSLSHKWYLDLIIEELQKFGYNIDYKILNAVDYGVPQNRQRIVVVGYKTKFNFPSPEKYHLCVQDAISDTMYEIPDGCKFLTASQDEYIAKYEAASKCKRPRDLHPDKPARTITCRNLAGATSDMHRIRLLDGRRRRITEREAARLQSFPDWFEFCGTETERFNQIGNAVPPMLAYRLACAVKKSLAEKETKEPKRLVQNKLV